MVKRPLLLVLTAYIIGSLLYEVPVILICLFVAATLVLVVGYLNKLSKNRHDQVLLILPVFFLLGYLLMVSKQSEAPMDWVFANSSSTSCTINGTVLSITKTESSNQIILNNVQYDMAEGISEKVAVYVTECNDLRIGNQINVYGTLSPFDEPTNAHQFDQAFYYKTQGIDYRMMAERIEVVSDSVDFIQQTFYELKNRMNLVLAQIGEEEVADSLRAMILGDKAEMEADTKELFQAGGIAHVISISGLHITLLGMAIYELIQKVIGMRTGVICSILFILFYGSFTNFAVATNRAVVMLILFLLAKLIGRTYDILSGIALSGLFILIREPMQVYQCGFLLSFGAVIGIAAVYPAISNCIDLKQIKEGGTFERKGKGKKEERIVRLIRYSIVQSLLYQISILIVTFPILLFFYSKYPTYSFLVNLIVLPFMPYVVIFGLLGLCVGCVSIKAGCFLLSPAVFLLKCYLSLCSFICSLPHYYLVLGTPSNWKFVLYYCFVLLGVILLFRKYRVGALAIIGAFIVISVSIPSSKLQITSIDVGQGDSYVIRSPAGQVYLVDGGSTSDDKVGTYRIKPYLYGEGIDTVDYWFVSHADEDHVSGVIELLADAKAGELTIHYLVVSDTAYEDSNYEELCAAAVDAGVEILFMEQGDRISDQSVSITCLHPRSEYMPSSANDYSLVLMIEYKEFSMLMMGDLSSDAEEELFSSNMLTDIDVLKVAHHGSKNSTSEQLLSMIRPEIALISCGENNTYGHPHEELLERLAAVHANVFITTKSGMLTLETDGESMKIQSFKT